MRNHQVLFMAWDGIIQRLVIIILLRWCEVILEREQEKKRVFLQEKMITTTHILQGCESICEKKSEIIWNAWKDVLSNALKLIKSLKMGFCEEQKILKSV